MGKYPSVNKRKILTKLIRYSHSIWLHILHMVHMVQYPSISYLGKSDICATCLKTQGFCTTSMEIDRLRCQLAPGGEQQKKVIKEGFSQTHSNLESKICFQIVLSKYVDDTLREHLTSGVAWKWKEWPLNEDHHLVRWFWDLLAFVTLFLRVVYFHNICIVNNWSTCPPVLNEMMLILLKSYNNIN